MDFSALEIFDYVVLAIVGLSIVIAFIKGFLKTILSLIVWVGAIVASFYLVPVIQPLVAKQMESAMAIAVVSFALSIIGSFILLLIVTIPVNTLLSPLSQGVMDRTFGFAFGVFRGVLLVCVLFITIILLDVAVNGKEEESAQVEERTGDAFVDYIVTEKVGPVWLQNAQTYTSLRIGSEFLLDILPDDFFTKSKALFADMKKDTKEGLSGEKSEDNTSNGVKEKLKDAIMDELPGLMEPHMSEDQVNKFKNKWKNKPENGISAEESDAEGYKSEQLQQLDSLIEQLQ